MINIRVGQRGMRESVAVFWGQRMHAVPHWYLLCRDSPVEKFHCQSAGNSMVRHKMRASVCLYIEARDLVVSRVAPVGLSARQVQRNRARERV